MNYLKRFTENDSRTFSLLIVLSILCLVFGLFLDVIDVDSAQYAALTMELISRNDFFLITERGQDYLDKPPLLFWLNIIAYKVLGASNFAYKILTVLCSVGTVLVTYKIGRLFYSKSVAINAVLILATCLGFYWINSDVKTDSLLLSCYTFSIFQLIQYLELGGKRKHLLLASIGIGCAMMAKGIMGIVFPGLIVFIVLLIKKKFKQIVVLDWVLLLVVVSIVIAPLCYSLYLQFDSKVINGTSNISGLRFYFWEQSFGRFTGENKWDNNASHWFLFHSLLLLIVPYSLLLIQSIWTFGVNLIKGEDPVEWYCVLGTILILGVLSFSQYQIPHYASIVFPFASILIAADVESRGGHPVVIYISLGLFLTLVLLATGYVVLIEQVSVIGLLLLLLTLSMSSYLILKKAYFASLMSVGVAFGLLFNTQLVPLFETYSQANALLATLEANEISTSDIRYFDRDSHAFEFYSGKRIPIVDYPSIQQYDGDLLANLWFYMSEDAKTNFRKEGYTIAESIEVRYLDVNRVEPMFFYPSKRAETLNKAYLVKLK